MGITRKQKNASVKLILSAGVAQELREVKRVAESAGFEFSLETEISEALKHIRQELESDVRTSGSVDLDDGRE